MGLMGGVIGVGHFLPVLYVVAALAGECFNIFAVVRSKWCYNTYINYNRLTGLLSLCV